MSFGRALNVWQFCFSLPQVHHLCPQMPDSVEELEEAISEAVDAANAVICNNPNVLEEYERRCKQVRIN